MGAGMAPERSPEEKMKMAQETIDLLREVTSKHDPEPPAFLEDVDIGRDLPDKRHVDVSRRAGGNIYYVLIFDEAGKVTPQTLSLKSEARGGGLNEIPRNIEQLRDAVRGLRDVLASSPGDQS